MNVKYVGYLHDSVCNLNLKGVRRMEPILAIIYDGGGGGGCACY